MILKEIDMTTLLYMGLGLLAILCAIAVSMLSRRALRLAGHEAATATATRLFGALAAWLAITAALAATGFLSQWDAKPPHFPIVPIAALAGVVLLQLSKPVRAALGAAPRHWPVAFQTFRIGVELSFWGLFLSGGAPVQVTFEGRNFDVLVGLSAPLIAFAIARFDLRPRLVITWNALGLAILFNTIFTTLSSLPGPLHRSWPGAAFTAFGDWPFVWIPAFLAPLAIFLHIFSIRQNLALLAAAGPVRELRHGRTL